MTAEPGCVAGRPPRLFRTPLIHRYRFQDMWRLEDKVEGSERYTASRGSERVTESSVVAGEGLGREADQGKTGCTCRERR